MRRSASFKACFACAFHVCVEMALRWQLTGIYLLHTLHPSRHFSHTRPNKHISRSHDTKTHIPTNLAPLVLLQIRSGTVAVDDVVVWVDLQPPGVEVDGLLIPVCELKEGKVGGNVSISRSLGRGPVLGTNEEVCGSPSQPAHVCLDPCLGTYLYTSMHAPLTSPP